MKQIRPQSRRNSGLVVGKAVGIFASTYVMARFTRAKLDEGLGWLDVLGVSILAGVGFTVSLLIGELAYGTHSESDDEVKIGVLAGSLLAAVLAAIVLRLCNRRYRIIEEQEAIDSDHDGIPDIYR